MSIFEVNQNRFDPYKGSRFMLKWDGRYVAGVSKVSALKRTTEVIEHRDGGDPLGMRLSVGSHKFEPITLERGVTHDPEFANWASLVWQFTNPRGNQMALANFRKDVTLELHNEAGQIVKAYQIMRAWVSEYSALPELDANSNAIAIESMVMQHEGFMLDPGTTEPSEPETV
jgi:phage tail-like protein